MKTMWKVKYIFVKCFHTQKQLYFVIISVKLEADEETFNEPLTWWFLDIIEWYSKYYHTSIVICINTKSIAEIFRFYVCYEFLKTGMSVQLLISYENQSWCKILLMD